MTNRQSRHILRQAVEVIAWITIALLSYFVLSNVFMSPVFHKATIDSLEEKEKAVMALAASSAATSTLISLIPDDIGTPIANQIAALTPKFIIILGAIVLQKVLVGVVGYISFSIIIPFACMLGIAYSFIREKILRDTAIKLVILGLVILAIIPAGVRVSDLLYETSQASINEAIVAAEQNEKDIEEKKQEIIEEDRNWIEKIEYYLFNVTSGIGRMISQILKLAENTLLALIEAVAIMVITTCVIPIIVVLVFFWIVNLLFGFDMGKIIKNSSFARTHDNMNLLDEEIEKGIEQ